MHHFSAGGLYNGLSLLIDDETRTYWDHITGEAVHGSLAGKRLDVWGIEMTTAGAALKREPGLRYYRSSPGLRGRLMSIVERVMPAWFIPVFAGRTMGERDKRLPEMELGLGVVTDAVRKFYPMRSIGGGIEDELEGGRLRVFVGTEDSMPHALWPDETMPMQLFSRWYGFAFTYPNCEIYRDPDST